MMSGIKETAPYGTWTSPITVDVVAGSSVSFKEVHADTQSGSIYLMEARPSENGRNTIIEVRSDEVVELLPKKYSVASSVHEYGGGAMTLSPDKSLIFTDRNTTGVFKLLPDGAVEEVIKGNKELRFADFNVHPKNHTLILAVHEDHTGKEVINTIALIDTNGKKATVMIQGADFYSHPKFGPDGKMISWMQWNHPDMPWTGSEVYVAKFENGAVGKSTYIAGKAREESIAQPKWHSDGTLLFCSDRSGFWQLYQYDSKTEEIKQLQIKGFEDSEFAGTEFELGCCTYISLNDNQLIITHTKNATSDLILHDLSSGETKNLSTDLVDIEGAALHKVSSASFAVIGATTTTPQAIYLIDIANTHTKMLIKSSSSVQLPESNFSKPESISYPGLHGTSLGSNSHAIFYHPFNPSFTAPKSQKPPLIISIHGGPTYHSSPSISLSAQYFTSRGYAYCYVNHAGSTGYGRRYCSLLNSHWGVRDCEDVISCVKYLEQKGWIDGTKVGIMGGSAGGYTVLRCLTTFPKVFAAGCSLYGIGNLKSLGEHTHKFESHYLETLLFAEGMKEEEREALMRERSPCFDAEKIQSSLLMLQGSEDKIVPIDQAREMEEILKKLGRDVELCVFQGEGHGFKREENIRQALEKEEALWVRCLL